MKKEYEISEQTIHEFANKCNLNEMGIVLVPGLTVVAITELIGKITNYKRMLKRIKQLDDEIEEIINYSRSDSHEYKYILPKLRSQKEEIKIAAEQTKNTFKRNGIIVGSVIMSGLIIYAGYKTYKLYLSQAGRACKGRGTGAMRLKCINDYKREGNNKRISLLKNHLPDCSVTKNPDACRRKINDEVKRVQEKMRK